MTERNVEIAAEIGITTFPAGFERDALVKKTLRALDEAEERGRAKEWTAQDEAIEQWTSKGYREGLERAAQWCDELALRVHMPNPPIISEGVQATCYQRCAVMIRQLAAEEQPNG